MSEAETHAGTKLHCGWGRLIFAHTYPDPATVAQDILSEKPGERNIAFYLTDPQLVLNEAPQDLFLDPSESYRVRFAHYQHSEREPLGFSVGPLESREDLDAINRIYQANRMVPVNADYAWEKRDDDRLHWAIARRPEDGSILGCSLGVDHAACFDDIENGSSLWSLSVDPQAELPGIGEFLSRYLIELFAGRGRFQLDLSVMADNENAIRLYKKLGFEKVYVFAIKCRNSINEKLFVPEMPAQGFNPYATIIINEALRRGISVDPIDPPRGFFILSLGGRRITCRESLSEMTSAIALQRCDDKQITRELLRKGGLRVPGQANAGTAEENTAFLERYERVVVKPARGEQGQGVFVDLRTADEVEEAVEEARKICEVVLLEEFCTGTDLRIIVINGEAVAAAIRKPAEIVGTGRHTARELIERLSRRRAAATGGESKIPLDRETCRCLADAGYELDDTVPAEEAIAVRKAANLHTGGTIHDVTAELHPTLAQAAVKGAELLGIPVTGFDFLVPEVSGEEYVIIEANERPGLANHEPQPTAQRFIDFLFPHSIKH